MAGGGGGGVVRRGGGQHFAAVSMPQHLEQDQEVMDDGEAGKGRGWWGG